MQSSSSGTEIASDNRGPRVIVVASKVCMGGEQPLHPAPEIAVASRLPTERPVYRLNPCLDLGSLVCVAASN